MKSPNHSETNTITVGGELKFFRIGLGTNRVTDVPASKEVLKEAVKLGVQFIDTADIYTQTASEQMIGKTLAPYSGLVIATKGGLVGNFQITNDPTHLRNAVDASLKRLRVSKIQLYQLHRVDPKFPIQQTMKILKEAQQAGKIQHIGLSEVTVAQIEEARKVVDIVSVQNHYNLRMRKYEDVVDYCEKEKIAFLPFFPLEHGKLEQNDRTLMEIAKKHGATPYQVAIAWLLKRSPMMLPIPGTLSVKHLRENVDACKIELSDKEFSELAG